MKSLKLKQLGVLLTVALAFAVVDAAWAQQIFGNIYGTVSDPSGSGVPDAKVTITDQGKGTKSEVTTNQTGNYTKDRLIPGMYSVEVEVAGFRKAVSKDVQVSVDNAARVDVTLTVGQVSESVEVTAEAPLLQSDRADVSTTFSAKQLVDLPRLDRNFQSYLLLSPGTNRLGWNHASSENPQGSIQITVNGQHFAGTGFQLDGTDNQDPILGIIVINPTIDSVTESKISGQNYDAEFGYTGSGIMNTSTKSGSNSLHGSAFDYIRNNSPGFITAARNPFNGAEDHGTPPLVQNQFGGSIGGPLIKNKVFWFGDAQLSRRRTGSSLKTSVPTALARTGDLSEYVQADGTNTAYDPLTGDPATGLGRTPFAGNIIPQNRLSPQTLAILKFLPSPNNVDQSVAASQRAFQNNYVASGSEAFDSNQWDTRWDYFINDKSSLFGRYSYAGFNKFAPGAFGVLAGGPALDNINFAGSSDVVNQSLALGYTRTISPTLIADVRFGYMRYRVNVLPNGLGTSPAKDAGIPGLNLDNYFTSGLPRFEIQGAGGTNLGYSLGTNQCNCPLAQREQQYQFVVNVTKIKGNHSIKVGGDIRRALNLRVPSDSHRAGELAFNNGYTSKVQDANGSTTQGLGLATFLLGEATSFNRYVSPTTDASEIQPRLFWYAQDTWRVTPKLQLNYGVRWEMVFPEHVNAKGNGGQLDLRTGEMVVAGVGGNSLSMIQGMNWKNLAPRIGITYQLNNKTVIRAGYGWSYQLGTFGSIFGHNVTQNLPVLANQQLNAPNNFSGVFDLGVGPPSPTFPTPDSNGRFLLPQGVNGKARPMTVVMPRVMAYNFTVQRQVSKELSVSVGYVGNVGRHVFWGGPNFNVNEAAFVPGVASSDLRKPYFAKYGWNQGIDLYCNCDTNQYNSMQIQVEKRFSGGLTFTSNYTYQKAYANSGDSFAFLYNRNLSWGEEDNITHQQFVFAPSWEIPFGRGRKFGSHIHKAVDMALGGWNLSGITTIYSGRPFTPNIGTIPSGASRPNAGPADRPDVGSTSPYSGAQGNRDSWFIGGLGSAFLLPANNTFGNFAYNGMRGPKFVNQDMSLAKIFSVTEKYRFSLRAETFNTFNHTNLGDPNSNVTDASAGKITGLAPSYQMRRVQFALRFDF